MRRHPATIIGIAALALGLAGCGGGSGSHHRRPRTPKTLVVYASLPLQGPLAGTGRELDEGIRLAIAPGGVRIGNFLVTYRRLDATSPKGGGASAQTIANAQRASGDARTIAYIGEVGSAQSALSIPILNEAGIPQISPTSTAVGLTRLLAGTPEGQPASLYPTSERTFMRLVPNDGDEAAADLIAMRDAACARVGWVSDGSVYGNELVALLGVARATAGVPLPTGVPVASPAALAPLIAALRGRIGGCVELAGVHAGELGAAAHAIMVALPRVRIFAPHALCDPAWARAALAGSAPVANPPLECTQVVRPLTALPGAAGFIGQFRLRYGVTPAPAAILGYEAMTLVLQTIRELGSAGDSRAAMLRTLLAGQPHASVLGTFAFDADGDTTLRAVALYRIAPTGRLQYRGAISAPRAG